MKLTLIPALLLAAGTLTPSFAQAHDRHHHRPRPPQPADLAECCTPGGKDFPKVGGNLGNQNYSRLRQINKGLVKKLGGAWVNRIEGGLTTGTIKGKVSESGGKTPLVTVPEASAIGFKILLYSTPALYVATQAMRKWLVRLRESGDLRTLSEASTTFSEFQSLIERHYRDRRHLRR